MSSQDYYSHQPSHLRPQYTPAGVPPYPTSNASSSPLGYQYAPPPIGHHYSQSSNYTPLKSHPLPLHEARGRSERRSRYDSDEEDDDSYSEHSDAAPSHHSTHSRRPQAITRRSMSHPGFYNRDHHAVVLRNKRQDSYSSYSSDGSDDDDDRSYSHHEKSHRNYSSERGSGVGSSSSRPIHANLSSHFTKSASGLGAGAVGAVAGGWLAKKAQDHVGHERRGSGSAFLTLVGAAVGGLALNAVAERVEERKKMRKSGREERWEGRSEVSRRRGSSIGSQGTRRSGWDDDRY
ncbi:hypothetical protein BP6252_08798 [Coleophoma cylindrospora]|uniref:Glycine zipper 2TM domain-containing protein n=1 Tax=Coleophoma cylindrospora TaxID=1849047 RepID=A0A3D8R770_9HELO|nr:hypothetical protein BP6252_08798 [Coleophoma cylindrospora]